MAHKLHPSQHRKSVGSLSTAQLQRLRNLLDTYITTQNPVGWHLAAANDNTLHIHGLGFLAWHSVFITALEQWLVLNGGGEFVPLPTWDPDTAIPARLSRGNHKPNPSVVFPAQLLPGAILNVPSYEALNDFMVPYHNDVHNDMGGQMPNPMSSPSDPIFYPFHAFLLAVYEHWRSH